MCGGEEVTENDWLQLANARYSVGKHAGAIEAAAAYLTLVSHPASKARGLLVRAKAELALNEVGAAQKTADEVLRLQPEGVLNGEARLVAGDILASQNAWEAAAKTYERSGKGTFECSSTKGVGTHITKTSAEDGTSE